MPPKNKKSPTFTYDGETYSLPELDDWPAEFQENQEEGKWVAAAKSVVGEDAYKRFKKKPRTMKQLNDFVAAMLKSGEENEGLEEGESDGS